MKYEFGNTGFKKIHLTIESEDELILLWNLFNVSETTLGTYDRVNLISDRIYIKHTMWRTFDCIAQCLHVDVK